MGSLPFRVETPAIWCTGHAHLGTSFLANNEQFLISEPSFLIDKKQVASIFLSEPTTNQKPTLEIDFKVRNSRLTFSTVTEHDKQRLDQLAAVFGWQMKPEIPALQKRRQLREPTLCCSCTKAAHERCKQINWNPLTDILTERIESRGSLLISIKSEGLQMAMEHQIKTLEINGSHLLANSSQSSLAIDVRHLHALYVNPTDFDNSDQLEIKLLNRHGKEIASLAAPNHEVSQTWIHFLQKRHYGYTRVSR